MQKKIARTLEATEDRNALCIFIPDFGKGNAGLKVPHACNIRRVKHHLPTLDRVPRSKEAVEKLALLTRLATPNLLSCVWNTDIPRNQLLILPFFPSPGPCSKQPPRRAFYIAREEPHFLALSLPFSITFLETQSSLPFFRDCSETGRDSIRVESNDQTSDHY